MLLEINEKLKNYSDNNEIKAVELLGGKFVYLEKPCSLEKEQQMTATIKEQAEIWEWETECTTSWENDSN